MVTTNHEKAVRDAAAALNSAAADARKAGYAVTLLAAAGGTVVSALISETAKAAKPEDKSPVTPPVAGSSAGAKTAEK
tara:strand:+ start:933 stop:1166 length:234 start_codon:yes stop_codon:yes gene_type:complete